MSDQKNWFEQARAQEARKKSNWWKWLLGLCFLLFFCSDGDRKEKRYCYNFGEEPNIRRACFKEKLAPDTECVFTEDGGVSCRIPS
ncbi:hypothetical protein ACFOHK_08285 [Falsigemmobacter intermedius]|uniref:Uncharacterized protein n=1 Tax=Falsigemmobacter intermedius TaxID=1553448 RepID=A0A451GGY9_9RHOB|nr:hypothetical protein [Falsigemmobacter intermedius]RWY37123.1 hypothetical protein EP867_17550 [Falsigemmobacter intermedius]